jgi:hypothetical protein
MSFDDTLQEVAGGRMRRHRPKSSIGYKPKVNKPKVNKKALLINKLKRHFGGFFEDTQDPPPASPMTPPGLEGGRRRRSKSPVRPARVRPVRHVLVRPVSRVGRHHVRGGDALKDGVQLFGQYFADPSLKVFADGSSNLGANTGQAIDSLINGGKKRRSTSPKRRPVRHAVSPTRRPVRRAVSPKPKRRAALPKRNIARPMF